MHPLALTQKLWAVAGYAVDDFGDDDGFSTGQQAAGTQLC